MFFALSCTFRVNTLRGGPGGRSPLALKWINSKVFNKNYVYFYLFELLEIEKAIPKSKTYCGLQPRIQLHTYTEGCGVPPRTLVSHGAREMGA